MKTTEKIIIAALAAVILIQFYQTGRINRVNESLTQRTNMLKYELSLIENNVAGRLNNVVNTIRQENELVTAVDWKHEGTASGKTDVMCEIVLKKLGEGQQPYLLFRDTSGTEWNRVELEKTEGLNFKAEFPLDAFLEYEYQVFIDGSEKTAETTERIPAHIYAYTDFSVGIQESQSPDDRVIVLNLLPRTKTEVEELKIKSAHAWFYSAGELIDVVEMKPFGYDEEEQKKLKAEKGLALKKNMSEFDDEIDRIDVIATYGDGRQREKTVKHLLPK